MDIIRRHELQIDTVDLSRYLDIFTHTGHGYLKLYVLGNLEYTASVLNSQLLYDSRHKEVFRQTLLDRYSKLNNYRKGAYND